LELVDHLLVFDIETIPDTANFDGSGFPKPPFHIPVAIAFLHATIARDGNHERYELRELRCGGDPGYSEAELIRAFIDFVERLEPRLVSYNGRSFDLPVIKYRAMVHGLSAPLLTSRDYTYRYSTDHHCDLLEVLTDFGASTRAKLDEVCSVLGFPGKIGVDGSMVAGMYEAGQVAEIRDYCELDVLNTYLVYLRHALLCGRTNQENHAQATEDVAVYLEGERGARPHLGEFLDNWDR
jgi:3'-5' exonuclease